MAWYDVEERNAVEVMLVSLHYKANGTLHDAFGIAWCASFLLLNINPSWRLICQILA